MRFNRHRTLIVLGSLLYTSALMLSYAKILAPIFSYEGLAFNPPPVGYIVMSWILALSPSLWLPIHLDRPSHVILWLLYVLTIIPTSLIPPYILDIGPEDVLVYTGSLCAAFIILFQYSRFPLIRIPRVRVHPWIFWTFIALMEALLVGDIISVFGFHLNVVALADVYSVRQDYVNELATSGTLVAYAISWQANVIDTLLMTQGLVNKKPVLFLLGVLGQLIVFSITGYKSVYLTGVLLVLLLVALRKNGRDFGSYVVWGSAVLILFCFLMDSGTNSFTASSIFVRRLMVVPGQLSGYYYEFFSRNPKALMGYGLLKPFVDSPYSQNPALVIGNAYFHGQGTDANANLWASGFADFGYAGVFGATIALGVLLWILDSVSRNHDLRLSALMVGIPAISLSNSALPTCILTHGMAFVILIIYLLPVSVTSNEGQKPIKAYRTPARLRAALLGAHHAGPQKYSVVTTFFQGPHFE